MLRVNPFSIKTKEKFTATKPFKQKTLQNPNRDFVTFSRDLTKRDKGILTALLGLATMEGLSGCNNRNKQDDYIPLAPVYPTNPSATKIHTSPPTVDTEETETNIFNDEGYLGKKPEMPYVQAREVTLPGHNTSSRIEVATPNMQNSMQAMQATANNTTNSPNRAIKVILDYDNALVFPDNNVTEQEAAAIQNSLMPSNSFIQRPQQVEPTIFRVSPVTGTFTLPVASSDYVVTSEYGYRIHPISGVRKFHAGMDIADNQGTPILATDGGVVVTATEDPGGYGYFIEILHDNGNESYLSLYGHMKAQSLMVEEGDTVEQGQEIGLMGSTGYSTGPHLHFEVKKRDADGDFKTLNPRELIDNI